jgi:hypothetical protein
MNYSCIWRVICLIITFPCPHGIKSYSCKADKEDASGPGKTRRPKFDSHKVTSRPLLA